LNGYYKKKYREDRKQKLSKRYIKKQKKIAKSQHDFIRYFLNKHFKGKKSLLEIGCGIGELLKLFKNDKWEVEGIEPDLKLSKFARENNKLDITTSTYKKDFYIGKKFNLIVLSHVFEHISDPKRFLEGIGTNMEKDSILYIEVPYDNYEKVELMIKLRSTSSHLYFYNINSLREIIEKAGFEEIFICTSGIKLKDHIRYLRDFAIIKKKNYFTPRFFITFLRFSFNKLLHLYDVYSRSLNFYSNSGSNCIRVAIKSLFKKI